MIALSPEIFSDFDLPLEDLISHQQESLYRETETSESILGSSSSQPQDGNSKLIHIGSNNDATMTKKLYHNASERDRRKRVNSLFSSLRSLLPATDQTKKLSTPTIVSRVLKYIPELQKEVETLLQKKESLTSTICRQEDYSQSRNKSNAATQSSSSVISASQLCDREIMVQISVLKAIKGLFAEVLLNLEQEGLLLLNMSCFESFEGRVFYNLHLQLLHETQVMDVERLRAKLLSLYENGELQC